MIKIQETDTLWWLYKRHYQGSIHSDYVPHPQNLCNYFHKAMGGLFKWFFWDMFFLVPLLFFVALTYGVYYLGNDVFNFFTDRNKMQWWGMLGSMLTALLIAACGITTALVPICRYFKFLIKHKYEKTCGVSGILLAMVVFDLLIGCSLLKESKSFDWTVFIWGFLIELIVIVVGVLIFAVLYVFSGQTNLGKNVRAFLKARKDNVCPLVDTPDSHKKKEREKQLHVGDG